MNGLMHLVQCLMRAIVLAYSFRLKWKCLLLMELKPATIPTKHWIECSTLRRVPADKNGLYVVSVLKKVSLLRTDFKFYVHHETIKKL